jgi:hypothetical protein
VAWVRTTAQADEAVGHILLNNFEFRRLAVLQVVVDKVLHKRLEYGKHMLQMVQRITGDDGQPYFEILT